MGNADRVMYVKIHISYNYNEKAVFLITSLVVHFFKFIAHNNFSASDTLSKPNTSYSL